MLCACRLVMNIPTTTLRCLQSLDALRQLQLANAKQLILNQFEEKRFREVCSVRVRFVRLDLLAVNKDVCEAAHEGEVKWTWKY